jgi:hypothetical protein
MGGADRIMLAVTASSMALSLVALLLSSDGPEGPVAQTMI